MKKFFKGLLMLSLLLVLALPVLFVGCTKEPTIKISIAQGSGNVYKSGTGMSDDSSVAESVVGNKNKYNKDGVFEMTISPARGYYISDVIVDGESLGEQADNFKYRFDDGKSHSVKVYFSIREWTITIMCIDGEYQSVKIKHGETLNLNDNTYGGPNSGANWYIMDGSSRFYLSEAPNPNVITNVSNNLRIYTELTRQRLAAIISAAVNS